MNNIEVSNPFSAVLGAGNYNIKCNISESQNYSYGESSGFQEVSKAQSIISLTFDKTSPQIYGNLITPFCSFVSGVGITSLKINETTIVSGELLDLSAGQWAFNCSYSGNQNYTSSTNYSIYTINRAAGNIRLFLNDIEGDIDLEYPNEYNITAFTDYGDVEIFMNLSDITHLNGVKHMPDRITSIYNITAVSSGNENYTSVSILRWLNVIVDEEPPAIEIFSPHEGTYGYNESIPLIFSVIDKNLDSCWYNVNNGGNVTLSSCENSSFDVGGDGVYALYLHANDTLGNEAVASATFTVIVGAPTITGLIPSGIYMSSNNVNFRYTPSGTGLEACELWGNFNGSFSLNQTHNSPINGGENIFSLYLEDGSYLWNIRCNNSVGNFAFAGANKTFYIDTVAPGINLTEPFGQKDSKNNIPIRLEIIENNLNSCWYNLTRWDGATWYSYRGNTNVNCLSLDLSFGVADEGNYTLYFTARDLAWNSNSTSIVFSVFAPGPQPEPTTPVRSGGGGGGGGVLTNVTSSFISRLFIEEVNAIMTKGEEKSLNVVVKNNGRTSANRCRIVADGVNSRYVETRDLKNIGIGELVEFSMIVKAVDKDVEKIEISMECLDNISTIIPMNIIFVENSIDVSIRGISFEKNNIKIKYSVKSTFNSKESIVFRVRNSEGRVIGEFPKGLNLKSAEEFNDEINFIIPNMEPGIFKLSVEDDVILIEESFIYSGRGVTGFALRDIIVRNSYTGVVLVIFLLLSILLLRRIWKLKKHSFH
jgi:hypothetical protein